MAPDQTLIQIRVDTQLKNQALEVFEKIGIDIPTAVRMFFKATVREQGLPFGTNVANQTKKDIELSETEKMIDYFRNKLMYTPPINADDDGVIVVLPLEYGGEVPITMYIQLITKVPEGCLTCWEDISSYLEKVYGRKIFVNLRQSFPRVDYNNNDLPYWRLVSARGVLGNGMISNELQREHLMKEGLQVVQRGNMKGSYRVENYKKHMFRYESLKIFKVEE